LIASLALLRSPAVIRFRVYLGTLLALGGIVGTLVHAQLSDEEKKKRDARAKAREEMRAVPSPTPEETPEPKAKPKPAKRKAKTKKHPTPTPKPKHTPVAKKSPTPEPDESPASKKTRAKKASDEDSESTPKPKRTESPEPTKKPGVKKSATPEPDETPTPKKSKAKKASEDDVESTPKPKRIESPEPTKKPGVKKSPTPEPDESPAPKSTSKKTSGAKKEPTPVRIEKAEPAKTPTPPPKAVAAPTRPPAAEPSAPPRSVPTPPLSQSALPSDITVEKSGLEKDQGFEPPPPLPPRRGFWPWARQPANYRYLTSATIDAIRRAPVQRARWKFIIVHNSGTRQGNARAFDYYHRRIRRMKNGLAYHFVIGNGTSSSNGQIEIGDRWRRQINGGHVHSDYLNNIALGICLVGDFNRDQPTRAQLEACEELIRYLRERCGQSEGRSLMVRPHREVNPPRWSTDCPGDAFPYSWFGRFR
jgi:hypothetical protein